MKKLLSAIAIVSLITLTGCGASLPAKSSNEPGTGVVAVPKSLKNEVSFSPAWATQIQITDANGKVVGKPLTLHPSSGRQFAFVSNLPEGQYKVAGYRSVGINESAHGSNSPMRPLGKGIPFTVAAGEVVVVPVVFQRVMKSAGVDSWQSRQNFLPLEGEELEEFKAVMAKANKNNEWQINWPQ